jgi:hypothetical protein
MRAFLRAIVSLSKPFEQELYRALQGLGAEAAAAYTELATKAAEPDLVRAIMQEMQLGMFSTRVLRPSYERHYARVAGATLETFNTMLGYDTSIPDPRMRQVLARGGTRAGLVDIERATRGNLRRIITEARSEGRGILEVARLIRHDVPAGRFRFAGTRYRSFLIAKTETKYAQNVAALEGYRAAEGITHAQAFDAQGAGETDDECQARDGQIFTFDDADIELASEHPGGTLSFAPVAGTVT